MALSVFSCWEVAKLVERGRMDLGLPVGDWMETALSYPGVELLGLTPEIVVESTQLPGTFHRDPADQLIVATARVEGMALATCDQKLLAYPQVDTLDLR
jgi:PIN domain nuclease of toxin-antitoxin system